MRIRSQISDNGNLCIERAHSRDTGPWRKDEELKTGGEKSCVCVCVCRKSQKLLTGRYTEREISMITQREREWSRGKHGLGDRPLIYVQHYNVWKERSDQCHTALRALGGTCWLSKHETGFVQF